MIRIAILLVGLVLAAGCGRAPAHDPHAEAPAQAATPVMPAANPHAQLRHLKTETAVPLAGGNPSAPFEVVKRSDSITQFPCISCHTEPLPPAVTGEAERRRSHMNINLQHGPDGLLSCQTCHSANDPGTLKRLDGQPVSIDHAYQLCGQCHMNQAKDWAGGAHGKRLTGWGYDRVVMSCTGCHNPHDPPIKPRWPVTFPSLPEASLSSPSPSHAPSDSGTH